jgi:hydroxypyruvate reductase
MPRIVTYSLRGDTGRAAEWFAEQVRSAARGRRPVCLLAGGETTVRVHGGGKGGRNQEFALRLASHLSDLRGVACLSAGSDGIDGPTAAAGAFVDPTTCSRARRIGLDLERLLARNDSYRFFSRLGDLFRPGATGTNVMDLKIAVVLPRVPKPDAAC